MKKMIITMALLLVSAVSIAEIVTDIPEITDPERDLLSSNYANVTLYKLLERSHVKDNINVVTVANAYPNSQCAKALRTVLYGHHKDAIYAVNLLNKDSGHICTSSTASGEWLKEQNEKERSYQNLMNGTNPASTQPEQATTTEQPTQQPETSQYEPIIENVIEKGKRTERKRASLSKMIRKSNGKVTEQDFRLDDGNWSSK